MSTNQQNEIDALRVKIVAEFSPHWMLNDEAHRLSHFAEVERCGIHINNVLDLKVSPKLIMLAAFFHDLFSWTRINHHELAYQFIKTSDNAIFSTLTDSERDLLAVACRHHRASYKGTFTYTIDELINSADRMFPVEDVTPMIERSLLCSLAKTEHPTEAAKLTHDHMKEKFGTGGYARYPALYHKAFAGALELQQQKIDALTQMDVITILLNFKPEFKYLEAKRYKHSVALNGSIPVSDLSNAVKTEPRYYVDVNRCDCHPETCCCDDYAVYDRRAPVKGGTIKTEKVVTVFTEQKANEIAEVYNLATM